ncbi:hypothetical protein CALCODRAFT_553654 [Calocera cornea HHB12733]|uniref:Uncharacterized protein n=1 Tax=Calocera cornea HHB12733 TaxID=1353952 RepID=A0A165IBW1_9BASI|nr:hypothetical protein CALCODRAFT_553654 [Calocera cornea HHB12733]
MPPLTLARPLARLLTRPPRPPRCRHLTGSPSSPSPFRRPSATASAVPEEEGEEGEPIERPPADPWFLRGPGAYRPRAPSPPLPAPTSLAPPPPPHSPPHIISIHAHLASLPQLDPATIYAGPPIHRPYNLDEAYDPPKGRRGRGSRYAGEGFGEISGLWSWWVVAQVKEGTEGRGAVDAVVRSTRAVLTKQHPELRLPPRSRRAALDGWAMLDLGDTAVHILSRSARDKWFTDRDLDPEEERLREMYGGLPFWFRTYTE